MPRFNQIIKISVLIVLTVVFSTLILFAIKDKISTKASQISQGRTMLISMDKRESGFVDLKDDYGIVKENLPLAKDLFPAIDDMDSFIDRVDRLALELGGTNIMKFDNNPEIFGQNLRKLNFTIVFSGKGEFFPKFINEFDKLPYFTKINGIEIRNASNSTANPDVITIDASIFLKK